MSLLKLRDVVVRYPSRARRPVEAVAGVDLDVDAGEILALVGESGCGKSSLGKAAVGLVAASGAIRFEGRDVKPIGRRARPLADRRLQMIFQDPYGSLNPRRKVGDLIADGARAMGETSASPSPEECLERVGLPASMATRFPYEFSGGQRQRIAIARALAVRPRCIVADEPISALDASAQASIARLLSDLVRELQMGLLFISHDLSIVRAIADRIAVMYLGKIVEVGPSAKLWADPIHPYTRALIGAVPRPDGRGTMPVALPGEVPDPAAPPLGCRFHPRCPSVVGRCSREAPAQRTYADRHEAACLVAAMRLDGGLSGL